MLKSVLWWACLVAAFSYLPFSISVNAQTSTPTPTSKGSISGTVKDESGNPVSGAKVSIKRSKKPKFKDSGSTGTQGQFEFSDLSAGKYILIIQKSGYSSAKKSIKLKAGKNKVVNVQLKTTGGGSGSGSGSGSGGGSGSGSGSSLGSISK